MTATTLPTAGQAPAPSPAVAPPPGNPRFALFDSLRGLAVLCIVAFHVASITGALAHGVAGDALTVLGPQSLIVFFAISGFLLYRPFVAASADGRRPPRTARYLRRRVLRIVPAYWLALTVLAIFPGLAGVTSGDWWRYYLFVQLYWEDSVGRGIPQAWSLCVEVSFYALLPLWAAGMRRLPGIGSGRGARLRSELVALAVVAACGVAVQVAAAQQAISDRLATTLLGQCVWLTVGMALAVASVAAELGDSPPRIVRTIAERPALCWLGALAAFVGIVLVEDPQGLAGIVQTLATHQPLPKALAVILLGAAMSALLVLPAVFGETAGGWPRRVLAWRPIALVGVISYGIYLWHLTIAEVIGLPLDPQHFSADGLGLVNRIGNLETPILFVITVAVTVTVAAASYRIVELPFLRLKER